MKVFISWSGERSQALAQALRDWLPLVIHYVEPWLSEADVAAGDRWAQEVAKELEASNFGIICVTPENVAAPWVLFEAGALAKSMQGARVVPLLFGLEFSDISGPLAQFQAKKVERSGVGEIVQSINHAADDAIPESRAKELFAALWPTLEERLGAIPDQAPTEKHMRPQHEIMEELVTGVRGLDSRFRELEGAVSERTRPRRHRPRFHPMMIEEIAELDDGEGAGLLMLAGLVREDLPWLYEVVMEAYREVRSGSPEATQRAVERIHRVTRSMGGRRMFEVMGGPTDETHRWMMELPMLVDHFLHVLQSRRGRSSHESDAPGTGESGD